MNNENEQSIHDKNFDEWIEKLSEDKKEEIFIHFYSNLRQQNGMLVELGRFWHLCWLFMTLEGSAVIARVCENECLCEDCAEDIDPDGKYHDAYVRWRIGNKSLMYDLHTYFYGVLLDESGDLMDFEEFLFNIWKFTTIEGMEFQIEAEKEIIEEHGEKAK